MTIYWKAKGVDSVSNMPHPAEDKALSFGTRITAGYKSALDKRVDVEMGERSLAFLLSVIAESYPDAIRNMAAELDGYTRPAPGTWHDFETGRRLREAAAKGIRKEFSDGQR